MTNKPQKPMAREVAEDRILKATDLIQKLVILTTCNKISAQKMTYGIIGILSNFETSIREEYINPDDNRDFEHMAKHLAEAIEQGNHVKPMSKFLLNSFRSMYVPCEERVKRETIKQCAEIATCESKLAAELILELLEAGHDG